MFNKCRSVYSQTGNELYCRIILLVELIVLCGIRRFTAVKDEADIPEIVQYLGLKLHTISESRSVSSGGKRRTGTCCDGVDLSLQVESEEREPAAME